MHEILLTSNATIRTTAGQCALDFLYLMPGSYLMLLPTYLLQTVNNDFNNETFHLTCRFNKIKIPGK